MRHARFSLLTRHSHITRVLCKVTTWDWERVNVQSAIWSKDPKEVGDDDYKSFYKSISKDYADPSTWIHFKVKEDDGGGVEGRRTHTRGRSQRTHPQNPSTLNIHRGVPARASIPLFV